MKIGKLSSKKVGLLSIKEIVGKHKDGKTNLYRCECDCGNEIIVKSSSLSGNTNSCGCLAKENQEIFLSKYKGSGIKMRSQDARLTTAKRVFDNYKDDGCSFEKFLELSQLPCYYCGRLPFRSISRVGKLCSQEWQEQGLFVYNGLDRIDSSLNHTESNLVPCCTDCNRAKMDLSIFEFKNLVKLIYNNFVLNEKQDDSRSS